jgi:phosphohistidine phosphatase SixA
MRAHQVLRIFAMMTVLGVPAQVTAQTIVIVRHAEKAAEPGNDPVLSEAGKVRAIALDTALAGAGVTAILTTQFRRTRDTAEPVAQRYKLTPQVMTVERGGSAAHIQEIARRAKAHQQGTLLIVGHSNSVPAIVKALGGPAMAELPECEYSRMFVLLPASSAQVIQTRYGAMDGNCL